jgi:quercetin dioxygenase-like cupin family protein
VSAAYQILSLDEIEPVPHRDSGLLAVRHALGFRAAGINGWKADPGGRLVPPHVEDSGNEELYVVVRGRATFTVDGERADTPAGTLVFVPPGAMRTAVAEEPGTIVLAVGGTVGQAFVGHGWDSYAVADAYRQAGRLQEGRAVLRKALAEWPETWGLSYNAACWEALAGDADAAFEHLRRAFRLAEGEVRKYAAHDTDLDPLRDDPRWQELLG